MKYLKARNDIKLYGKNYYFIAKNELLTLKEFYKLRNKKIYYNLSINDFDLININKNKTAYIFGIRKEL